MLIEFEDRTPATLTIGDKVLVGFAMFGSALAVIGLASTVVAWGIGAARSLGLTG